MDKEIALRPVKWYLERFAHFQFERCSVLGHRNSTHNYNKTAGVKKEQTLKKLKGVRNEKERFYIN